MLCLNDGLSFAPKDELGYFSSLVFKQALILLLLTDSCRGQSQGVGPSQTIVAVVGDDVILPCHLEPAADVVSKSLEWGRPDLEPRFVHVWHEGQNLVVNQNPSYKGRTSLSSEKLKHGDLSLKLSAVKHSDNGVYRCYFPSQDKESTVELVVAAGDPTSVSCNVCCFILGLVGGLACGLVCLVVVYIVWKCKKSTILLHLSSANKKGSSEKKTQLQKQSQNTQEELNTLGAALTPSMELKRGLETQKEELRLQLEEIKREMEENKDKIYLVEKEIAESMKVKAAEKTDGYLREKQNLVAAKGKLEMRKDELEKQQLNTEKLRHKTESIMATITERKRKVENRFELINLQLEEVESDDLNAHLHRE